MIIMKSVTTRPLLLNVLLQWFVVCLYCHDQQHTKALAFSDTNNRVPWDALRFIRQSSKFITLPPNPISQIFVQTSLKEKKIHPGDVLWSPIASSSSSSSRSKDTNDDDDDDNNNNNNTINNNNLFTFSPLDDVVMGGASKSTFDESTGIWSGTVTSANNGGFVGIRSTPFRNNNVSALNMEACTGIQVKVRGGNGQRFKGTTRDSTEFNGICWTTSFDAPSPGNKKSNNNQQSSSMIKTIKLPFDKQIPTIFARTVPNAQSFQKNNVQGIQFAYSKFEYDGELNNKFTLGEFYLQILEIRAY